MVTVGDAVGSAVGTGEGDGVGVTTGVGVGVRQFAPMPCGLQASAASSTMTVSSCTPGLTAKICNECLPAIRLVQAAGTIAPDTHCQSAFAGSATRSVHDGFASTATRIVPAPVPFFTRTQTWYVPPPSDMSENFTELTPFISAPHCGVARAAANVLVVS